MPRGAGIVALAALATVSGSCGPDQEHADLPADALAWDESVRLFAVKETGKDVSNLYWTYLGTADAQHEPRSLPGGRPQALLYSNGALVTLFAEPEPHVVWTSTSSDATHSDPVAADSAIVADSWAHVTIVERMAGPSPYDRLTYFERSGVRGPGWNTPVGRSIGELGAYHPTPYTDRIWFTVGCEDPAAQTRATRALACPRAGIHYLSIPTDASVTSIPLGIMTLPDDVQTSHDRLGPAAVDTAGAAMVVGRHMYYTPIVEGITSVATLVPEPGGPLPDAMRAIAIHGGKIYSCVGVSSIGSGGVFSVDVANGTREELALGDCRSLHLASGNLAALVDGLVVVRGIGD